MKQKKRTKPLAEATVGDLTDRQCGYCGHYLQISEVDLGEKLAWLACPTYLANPEFNKEEHSFYSVPLEETGYREGHEIKPNLVIKKPHVNERPPQGQKQ